MKLSNSEQPGQCTTSFIPNQFELPVQWAIFNVSNW